MSKMYSIEDVRRTNLEEIKISKLKHTRRQGYHYEINGIYIDPASGKLFNFENHREYVDRNIGLKEYIEENNIKSLPLVIENVRVFGHESIVPMIDDIVKQKAFKYRLSKMTNIQIFNDVFWSEFILNFSWIFILMLLVVLPFSYCLYFFYKSKVINLVVAAIGLFGSLFSGMKGVQEYKRCIKLKDDV